VAFGRKWDPEGKFVRRYVPELKDFPEKYIYEPWKAPIADQKAAGCLVRGDRPEYDKQIGCHIYPKPMFDFQERRDVCMKAIKKAYEVRLYGNDPRVLDGSWRALFNDNGEGPTEGMSGPPGAMLGKHTDGESGDHGQEEDGKERHEDSYRDEHERGQRNKSQQDASPRASRSGAGQGRKRAAGQMSLDGFVKKVKE